MCGYASEGAPATAEDLIVQFESAIQRLPAEAEVVKIYTSGSFLDQAEVPPSAMDGILQRLEASGIRRLIVESRPQFITSEGVEACLSHIDTEFAIGLETSSDLIREHVIRKGFSFSDFVSATELVHRLGGSIRAYLLLKPPLLSEGEALRDAIASAHAARPFADLLSLNLCNVQRGTPLERMWERGEYRPPWLWSALEVLRSVGGPILCDPVGAGTRRGPHNCGRCDSALADAIRRHAIEQNAAIFDGLSCECREAWSGLMDLEERSFGTPLQ